MGGGQAKDTSCPQPADGERGTNPRPQAQRARAAVVDPEYLVALQRYGMRAERLHRQMSRKKTMPAPKPPPVPPDASEAWSVEELCDFVRETLERTYGQQLKDVPQVVANIQAQMLDGSRLKHLQPEDWERICPCIGPRTHIMESIKKVGPAKPKVCAIVQPPPTCAAGEDATGDAVEVNINAKDTKVDQILGLMPAKITPGPDVQETGDARGNCAADDADVAVRIPKEYVYRPPEPATLPIRKLLTKRSKFSNHRLVDTAWSPDMTRCWLIQLWQIFLFEILRIGFIAMIIRKFGLRVQQWPYIAAPLIAVYICYTNKFFLDFSPTLYTIIVVFPLSFSLNAAYQRREQSLQTLASIKSSSLGVHLFAESWIGSQLELPDNYVAQSASIIKAHFHSLGHYLTAVNEGDKEVILTNILRQYSDLFYHVDLIRLSGLPPPLVTVPFNNVINMALGFENLRVFSDYRTPCSLRTFCKVTIGAMAFCLAPVFANSCKKYGAFYGYMLSFFFFWLLLCMDNIQAMLENPFLTFGRSNAEDDINLAALKGVVRSKKKRRAQRQQMAEAETQFQPPSSPQ